MYRVADLQLDEVESPCSAQVSRWIRRGPEAADGACEGGDTAMGDAATAARFREAIAAAYAAEEDPALRAAKVVVDLWTEDLYPDDDATDRAASQVGARLTVALPAAAGGPTYFGPSLVASVGSRLQQEVTLVPTKGCRVSGSLTVAATFRPFTKLEAMQAELDLPKEIVKDLLTLELTEVVVVADDSGSMNTRNANGTTRWDELKSTMRRLLTMLIVVDHQDGFLLKFLNDEAWYTVDSPETLDQIFASLPRPSRATPLLRNLQPIVNRVGRDKDAETLVFIMTDGAPSDGTVYDIQQLLNARRRGIWVSFLMCTDEDDVVEQYNQCVDPVWGCDITDDFESERRECAKKGNQINYNMWLAKAVLGGKIGHKYDALDEKKIG